MSPTGGIEDPPLTTIRKKQTVSSYLYSRV